MSAAFDRAQSAYDAAVPDWVDDEAAEVATAQTVAAAISELISELTYLDDVDVVATFSTSVADLMGATVRSYGDAGFVLAWDDGSEYQITIIRSR